VPGDRHRIAMAERFCLSSLRRNEACGAENPRSFPMQCLSRADLTDCRHHLCLRVWFRAMYHMTQSKQGISSIELGRRLGVKQGTAWTIKHKLKQVMMERDGAWSVLWTERLGIPMFWAL
jgi:hypothetical protein